MAHIVNLDNPNGFQPVGLMTGLSFAGNMRRFGANGSGPDIFRGDMVKLEADGNVRSDTVGNTDSHLGIYVGIDGVELRSVGNTEALGYYDASEGQTEGLIIIVGLGLIVEAQEDGVGDLLEELDRGMNVEIIATTGNLVTGLSQQEIDSSSDATTATLPLTLLRLVDRPDNQYGDDDSTVPNARWLAVGNNMSFAPGRTGLGL